MTTPETHDSMVGTWTLFVRTHEHPATTTYTATFEASGTDTSKGTVTVTGGGTPVSGKWHQAKDPLDEDENVHFTIPDPAGGKDLKFSGHLVGNAVGGTIRHELGLLFFGAWSACRSGG